MKKTIAEALTGNLRPEHLLALKQAVNLYDRYKESVAECDAELEKVLADLIIPLLTRQHSLES